MDSDAFQQFSHAGRRGVAWNLPGNTPSKSRKYAEKERIKNELVSHRVASVPWRESCAIFGISKSTYFRYLDEVEVEVTEATLKNRDRMVHDFYQRMNNLYRHALKAADDHHYEPAYVARVESILTETFDHLVGLGALPEATPTSSKTQEGFDRLFEESKEVVRNALATPAPKD